MDLKRIILLIQKERRHIHFIPKDMSWRYVPERIPLSPFTASCIGENQILHNLEQQE